MYHLSPLSNRSLLIIPFSITGQMRTRNSSPGAENKLDSPMEQHGRSPGGKWFTLKLAKLRRNSKSHTNASDLLDTAGVYKPLKGE